MKVGTTQAHRPAVRPGCVYRRVFSRGVLRDDERCSRGVDGPAESAFFMGSGPARHGEARTFLCQLSWQYNLPSNPHRPGPRRSLAQHRLGIPTGRSSALMKPDHLRLIQPPSLEVAWTTPPLDTDGSGQPNGYRIIDEPNREASGFDRPIAILDHKKGKCPRRLPRIQRPVP